MSARNRERRFKKWQSAYINTTTFWVWYERLKNIALNCYEWENLPPSIDQRFLELMLFERGYCLFFQDKALDVFLCLPCTLSGKWNIYNIPVTRRAWANNGYQATRTNLNSILIFTNYLHTSLEEVCTLFAGRLYEIERTIDVNVKAQKTPLLISSDESARLSMKNLYMNYDGNEPVHFTTKAITPDTIQVLKTDAPYVADKLQNLKHQYFNEWLSYLGIENSNEDKKERMVANEVGSNYGNIEASRSIGLTSRRDAAEKINGMFGLNIKVNFRSNLDTLVNRAFTGFPTGEMVDNEPLYNGSPMDSRNE